MKWYVIIKVFYVFWSSFGPYDSREICAQKMVELHDEGISRYSTGERVTFMGKQVDPKNVSMSCQRK